MSYGSHLGCIWLGHCTGKVCTSQSRSEIRGMEHMSHWPPVFSDNPDTHLCEYFHFFCFWEKTIASPHPTPTPPPVNVTQQCSNSICRAVDLHQLQIWSLALITCSAFVWCLTAMCMCLYANISKMKSSLEGRCCWESCAGIVSLQ